MVFCMCQNAQSFTVQRVNINKENHLESQGIPGKMQLETWESKCIANVWNSLIEEGQAGEILM